MIRPAHEPRTGTPVPTSSRRGSPSPSRSIPNVIVVDSPPGITSPSRPSRSLGTRTSRTSAPNARSIRPCASNPPCRASTPIVGTPLPAALGEELLALELRALETLHRRTQPARSLGYALGVLPVRRRLDDCPRA